MRLNISPDACILFIKSLNSFVRYSSVLLSILLLYWRVFETLEKGFLTRNGTILANLRNPRVHVMCVRLSCRTSTGLGRRHLRWFQLIWHRCWHLFKLLTTFNKSTLVSHRVWEVFPITLVNKVEHIFNLSELHSSQHKHFLRPDCL